MDGGPIFHKDSITHSLESFMRSRTCLWAIVLSLLPILSYAQNQNNSQVRELYVRSGMQKQLEQLPSIVQAMFDQSVREDDQGKKLPKALISAMSAAVSEAFSPRRLQATMIAELSKKLTARDIKDVFKWLDSPLGSKCTRLEETSSTAEAQADMEKYAAGLQASPPTAKRMKVVREFDSAVKATDGAVDTAINTQIALALAIMATFPRERQMPLDAVAREMEKNRPALEANVRSQVLISHLYTYRSLTDAEIKLYADFARSPVGLKYHAATLDAFKKATLEGAVKWGELIGEAIKQTKGNSEA
jgi:hypothetical protein